MNSEKTKRKIKISRGNTIYIAAVLLMLGLCLAAFLSTLNAGFCDWWKMNVYIPYTTFMRIHTSGTETVYGKYILRILLVYFALVFLVLILRIFLRTDNYIHFRNICIKSCLIVILSIVLFSEAIWYIPLNATFLNGAYTGTEPVYDEILKEYYAYLIEENKKNDKLLDHDKEGNLVFVDEYAHDMISMIDTIPFLGDSISDEFIYLKAEYPYGFPYIKWIPSKESSSVCAYYQPFTAELVMENNIDQWGFISMYTHLLAHYKGYLRESEAQFVAWKICMESDDPYYRRVGLLQAMDLVEYNLKKRYNIYDLSFIDPDWEGGDSYSEVYIGEHSAPFFLSPSIDYNNAYLAEKFSFMGPLAADGLEDMSETDEELGWKMEKKISGNGVYDKLLSLMIEDYRHAKEEKAAEEELPWR